MKQAQRVRYNHPEMGPLTVERLHADKVSYQVARQVRHLIGAAYGDEFESLRTPVNVRLSKGRISNAYLVDSAPKIQEQQDRIEKAIKTGSSYWVLHAPAVDQGSKNPALDGLVKTTPSRGTITQRLHLSSPNCYLNDIMVRPGAAAGPTFRGVGSILLHTALRHDRYDSTATVVADTYRYGRTGPRFFTDAGFTLNEDSLPEPTMFNQGEESELLMPMDRREAQIYDVVQRLTARFDWLATAEVEYTA